MRTLLGILIALLLASPVHAQPVDPPRPVSMPGGTGATGAKGATGDTGAAGAAGADGVPYADPMVFSLGTSNIGAGPVGWAISADGATNANCTWATTQKITTAVTIRFKPSQLAGTVLTWEEIGIGYVSTLPRISATTTLTVAQATATTLLSTNNNVVKTYTFSGLTIPAGVYLCALFSQNGDSSNGQLVGADVSDPLALVSTLVNTDFRPTASASGTFTGSAVVGGAIVWFTPVW